MVKIATTKEYNFSQISKRPKMLIDTHCHINMMVKTEFDTPMQPDDFMAARNIINESCAADVTTIINVGTSLIESNNCIELAKKFPQVYSAIGIHPNDLTENWVSDFKKISSLAKNKEANKILGIGETGIDMYRPGFNLQRQKDAFKAQIELALEHDLAIIVHSRSAPEETLRSLEEYNKDIKRCVIHCFSEGFDFAETVIDWGFVLGIGGTITYPKNDLLRDIVNKIDLKSIVLETDAPFLPPQIIRGKQNHPKYIKTIAEFIAQIREQSFEKIAQQTTQNSRKLFNI